MQNDEELAEHTAGLAAGIPPDLLQEARDYLRRERPELTREEVEREAIVAARAYQGGAPQPVPVALQAAGKQAEPPKPVEIAFEIAGDAFREALEHARSEHPTWDESTVQREALAALLAQQVKPDAPAKTEKPHKGIRVLVSVNAYHIQKTYGLQGARDEIRKQLRQPSKDSWAFVHTMARIDAYFSLQPDVDVLSGPLTQIRTGMFYNGYVSGADVWVSCDDDVEASSETCRQLVVAASEGPSVPRVIVAAYRLRLEENDSAKNSLTEPRDSEVRISPSGIRLVPTKRAGFGLVAVNRAAMEKIHQESLAPTVRPNGREMKAVFHEYITPLGEWYGEDLSFFWWLPKEVQVEALVDAVTIHDGMPLVSSPGGIREPMLSARRS